jgi:3D-(3,5/4)-trihydroxycyclohexane-1,2-dione acylhydrolase (decyclizing)
VTVVVFANGGYQSIHGLQRATVGVSFGNEFAVAVDHAGIARCLGCQAWNVETVGELERALAAARAHDGPCLIECAVDPVHALPGSGGWWDLGTAQASDDPRTRALVAAHAEGAAGQRFYG